MCHHNFCGEDFLVFKTNSEIYFCHKAETCTFTKCSRSSSRLSCSWLRGEKGKYSEALSSVPNSGESVPEQWAYTSLFLNSKLDAFSHISSRLGSVPYLPYFLFFLSTLFSGSLFSFFKPNPSVFPSALILLPGCTAYFF